MKKIHHLTVIIEKESEGYVSFCPELDIAVKVTALKRQEIV